MKAEKFGVRLRQLRKQAGLTQRELAERVNVDFTYLSKIESGAMPPPSEKVILQLAEALNTDKDELIILAGRVPSDIAEVLKNGETLQFLRADGTRKVIGASNKIRRSSDKVKRNLQIFNYKNFSKIAIAAVLVLAVATSLWFVSPVPVRALSIDITPPAAGTFGSTHVFTVEVVIANTELLPIENIDLYIYKVGEAGTYKATCENLPLNTLVSPPFTTIRALGSSGTYGTVSITASTTDWEWFYGAGYAYWAPTGYSFPTGYGYGYSGTGTASIIYTVNWTSPTDWTAGQYKIEVKITANSIVFLQPSSAFTLSAPSAPAGRAEEPAVVAPAAVTEVGSVDITAYIDSTTGITTADISLSDTTGKGAMSIPAGTRVTLAGNPYAGPIQIIPLGTPPPPAGYNLVGPAYDCLPDGLTFEPAITLTFTYEAADIPDGVSEEDLVMAYWDGDTWVMLATTVNTVANTVSSDVAHFTPFAILAELPLAPAAFVTTDLSITPAEVDIGEEVTISVLVTNTGGLTDSYEVTLKVDEVLIATEEVTLAGGTSQTVTFTTAKDVAATYAVTVDDLSGTFVVTEVIPPPPPMNWWLIGGIIAAVIIIGFIIWQVVARRRA